MIGTSLLLPRYPPAVHRSIAAVGPPMLECRRVLLLLSGCPALRAAARPGGPQARSGRGSARRPRNRPPTARRRPRRPHYHQAGRAAAQGRGKAPQMLSPHRMMMVVAVILALVTPVCHAVDITDITVPSGMIIPLGLLSLVAGLLINNAGCACALVPGLILPEGALRRSTSLHTPTCISAMLPSAIDLSGGACW
jgi:hypothetical protein